MFSSKKEKKKKRKNPSAPDQGFFSNENTTFSMEEPFSNYLESQAVPGLKRNINYLMKKQNFSFFY